MQTKYIQARISSKSGMGGAFDAPGYPTLTHRVETDLNRKPDNRGGLSLVYALTCDYISPTIKQDINKLIADWNANKPPITDISIQNWIKECIAHWGSSAAGKEHITKFYPEYIGIIV